MEGPFKKLEDEYRQAHEEALREHAGDRECAKAEKSLWQDNVTKATKDGTPTPLMPRVALEHNPI
jgi:hypothetical protein